MKTTFHYNKSFNTTETCIRCFGSGSANPLLILTNVKKMAADYVKEQVKSRLHILRCLMQININNSYKCKTFQILAVY